MCRIRILRAGILAPFSKHWKPLHTAKPNDWRCRSVKNCKQHTCGIELKGKEGRLVQTTMSRGADCTHGKLLMRKFEAAYSQNLCRETSHCVILRLVVQSPLLLTFQERDHSVLRICILHLKSLSQNFCQTSRWGVYGVDLLFPYLWVCNKSAYEGIRLL